MQSLWEIYRDRGVYGMSAKMFELINSNLSENRKHRVTKSKIDVGNGKYLVQCGDCDMMIFVDEPQSHATTVTYQCSDFLKESHVGNDCVMECTA